MNSAFNKNSFLIIFIYAAIIASVVYFFILPTYNNYQTVTQKIETDQQTCDKTQRTLAIYQKLNQKKDEIQKYASKTSKLVPKDANLENYLIDLEAMIAQSSIPSTEFQLASLSPDVVTNSPSVIQGIKNYQITLDGDGNVTNIINLINQLMSMSRLTELTAINLTSGDNGSLSFSLIGNIFSNPKSGTQEPKNPSKVLTEAETKISQYETHSQPIEIQKEDGFGRPDPFASY